MKKVRIKKVMIKKVRIKKEMMRIMKKETIKMKMIDIPTAYNLSFFVIKPSKFNLIHHLSI